MAQWHYKPAGSFPVEFHEAMKAGVGTDKLVKACYTRLGAERWQVEWRIFRYSLRFDTGHPTSVFERKYKHRTRIAYHGQSGMWHLLLTSREDVLEGIEVKYD